MGNFNEVIETAAKLKGGKAALRELLPVVKSADDLAAVPDDRWLAGMALVIFRSGFSWKVVESKWPGFEEAFYGFNPKRVAMFSDEELDQLTANKAIIRNGQKIHSVYENAILLSDLADEHGSAAKFFADWPADDFTGLWTFLKEKGSRLGGKTGAYFLREMGRDTPVMSKDVVAALIREGMIDKEPTSKSALAKVQQAFEDWRAETGLPYAHLSRILAASVP